MQLIEKTLSMTEGEILRSYKEAKDQKKQLTILAQLNDCPVEVIKMILKKQGIDGRSFPRERGKKGEASTPDLDPAQELATKETPANECDEQNGVAEPEKQLCSCEETTCTAQGVVFGVYGNEIRNNVRHMIRKTAERKAELESCIEGLRRDLAECDVLLNELGRVEEALS